ncbi:MAG: Ig-like domain-containing protein [Myxococcota bacterium]
MNKPIVAWCVQVGIAIVLSCAGAVTAYAQCNHGEEALCDLNVTSLIEQPELNRAVDVVLVGDGFIDMEVWQQAALEMIAVIREEQADTTIYPAVEEVYNFHIVDVVSESTDVTNDDTQDTPLGMRVQGFGFIAANNYYASLAAANAPDVDVVYAIANATGGRANANYPSSLTTGGSVRMSRSTVHATHELGHAVFRLADEYTEDSACNASNTEAGLVSLRNVTRDPQCGKFANAPGSDCVEGNYYCRMGHYRAASQCVMRSSGNNAPCPVCRGAIEEMLLARRTGGDFGDPWAVVLQPTQDQVVSGVIDVRVHASDYFGSSMVVILELDGRPLEPLEALTSTLVTSLDTRQLLDGTHRLTPLVLDSHGHGRRGPTVDFIVQNAEDRDPPMVRFITPGSGQVVSGEVFVQAEADDSGGDPEGEGSGLELLAIYADDQLLTATRNGWASAIWDTTQLEPGLHTLRAVARDHAQNVGISSPLMVQVSAGTPTSVQPYVFMDTPRRWDPVGSSFVLGFSHGQVDATARFTLLRDGEPVEPDPFDGWVPTPSQGRDEGRTELLVDASGWSEGQHILQLRITYGEGQEVRSEPPTFVYRVDSDHLSLRMVQLESFVAGEATVHAAVVGPGAETAPLSLEVLGYGVVATVPPHTPRGWVRTPPLHHRPSS